MSEEENLKNVEFRYSKDQDYKLITASGIWGGVNQDGMVFFDLFLDYQEPPDFVEREIKEHELGPEKIHRSKDSVIVERLRQIGVLMTPKTAMSVAKWLNEKAELAVKGANNAVE